MLPILVMQTEITVSKFKRTGTPDEWNYQYSDLHHYCMKRDPKFLELLKKNYLKYSYKFETLAPFKLFRLLMDAVIPVPLPLLETLSKIFRQKCYQGPPAILVEPLQCQQKPPFWLKTKWWLCPPPPLTPSRSLRLFFVPRDESGFERETFR